MTDHVPDPLAGFPALPEAEAARGLMPNLFVIGASKSGSSALHAYIRYHPEIRASEEKEPCFFVDQQELEEAWPIMARQPCSHQWPAYLDLYAGGEDKAYRAEGSVYYSQAPHRSQVAPRIAHFCPDAKIVYVVREPVSRAVGHYWQRFKEFQESLPIGEAMRSNAIYRDSSDYALQLREYQAHFPPEQIKVIVAEDLRTRRREVMSDLFGWLGIADLDYSEEQLAERHKSPSTTRTVRFPLVRALRDSALWSSLRRVLPQGWIETLRKASTTTFEKSQVDESGARDFLARHLAPRRAEFEAMIGRHIEAWGPPAPQAAERAGEAPQATVPAAS